MENYSREAFINCCRICFRTELDISDLFSTNEQCVGIIKSFYLCFQIVLTVDKDLPKGLCRSCIETLNNANRFRMMCLTISERFTDFIKQLEMNSDIEENSDYNTIETICDAELKDDDHNKTIKGLTITETFTKDITKVTNVIRCEICNKTLKNLDSLLKHKICMHQNRKHVGKVTGYGDARLYHCTTCSYSTPHSQTLINHMRRHNGERPYSCKCGKNFTQRSSLAAHQKTHYVTTYFTCSVCGKQFKHAFALKNHLKVHNSGEYSCSICKKIFKYQRSLKVHMLRHYNIYNFSCECCGDTFVSSSELINHKDRHKTEKRMECHVCGYKTNSKKNLTVHLKRHAGEKDFKCEICQVSFYTQSDLQKHHRKHTREKPYSCNACAQKFAHSPSLNKHMKTVHGVHYKWSEAKQKQARNLKITNTNLLIKASEVQE